MGGLPAAASSALKQRPGKFPGLCFIHIYFFLLMYHRVRHILQLLVHEQHQIGNMIR
jgi:hypothetical protein